MPGTITDESQVRSPSQIEAITQILADKIGAQKYRIWFKDSAHLSLNNGFLTIGVPNAFTARWIETHFIADLQGATEHVTGTRPQVSFSVIADTRENQRRNVSPHKVTPLRTRSAAQPTPPAPPSRKLKLSFDTFVVGPSNQLAYNAAQVTVREQNSPFNPLFIHGGYGVGKTHLLQAVCNAISTERPQAKWLYLSAEDFANQFVLGLKTKKLEAFRRRMRQTDLLAIDDIHFLSNKPSTQEEFLHTFNSINLAGKQVVLVSDAPPKQIGQLSEKLVNRFVSGMVVKIDAPDFETRCKICEQCAQTMLPSTFGAHPGSKAKPTRIPTEIIHYIAQTVHTNIRELEGALLKVIAYSALQGEKLNLAMVKNVLADHVERCDPVVHLSDIETAVANFFGTTTNLIHSSKKDKTVSLARHFSMYLARKHTKMSSSEVGRLMGNKNHATVLVACKKVDDMLTRDAELNWRNPNGNKVTHARKALAEIEQNISK